MKCRFYCVYTVTFQKHVIVLEEEVILAPDFLNFVAQCVDAIEKDDTLIGVSAWNDNGKNCYTSVRYQIQEDKTLEFLQ